MRWLKREMLKTVNDIFHEIDEDKSGLLDRAEVAKLAAKVTKRYKWLQLDPPFDSERDFDEIPKAQKDTVTMSEFDAWWRDRIGDDEPNIPIFPEYMVKKIEQCSLKPDAGDWKSEANNVSTPSAQAGESKVAGADQSMHAKASEPMQPRTGEELWRFLRPRLKLLVQFEQMWGKLHDLYPQHSESRYVEGRLRWSLRHPESIYTVYWDMAQIVALGEHLYV